MAFPNRRRDAASAPEAALDAGPVDILGAGPGPVASRPLTERIVERASFALDRRTDRRSVVQAAALVGSALATGGVGYILRPGTAYASVCGDGATCTSGWTAFCCTVHGSNTCPPYSFPAGWWKIDASPFCSGQARYIVDCNATCPTQCSCRCASGTCDERRTCCNQFRYGQCNTQIACAGPVVCRVALCTPPWVWSPACTTTSLTDNRTLTHNAPCLSPTPTKEDPVQLVSSGVIPPDRKLYPFSVAPVNVGAYGNCYVRVSAASFSRIDSDPTQTVRISVGSIAEGWQTIERLQLQNGSVTAFKVAPGSSKGGNIVNNSTVPVTVLVEHFLA